MKERTSAGPSGIHMGHLKAIPSVDDQLILLHATMMDIPLLSGQGPSRWQQCIDVMITKKPGDYRINRLRTITLLEADMNLLFKFIGKLIMEIGEETGTLAGEQYGSRKNKDAITQCLNKSLLMDIIRQRKCRAAICSNDASQCYDRITHPMVSLSLGRIGIPQSYTSCILSTIQSMKHQIRTGYGDSDCFFTGESWTVLPQGVIQSGMVPAIWATISSVLFDIMRDEESGSPITSLIEKDTSTLLGFAFVDDTDLIILDDELLLFFLER